MGFEKEVLRAGTGPKPVPGQNVTVHCTGFGKNGDLSQKFWRVQQVSGENIEYHGGTTHVKSPANQRVIAMMLNISPVISTSVLFWFENLGIYPSFKCNFLCPKIFAFPYFVSIFGRHVSTKDAGQKPFTFKIGQGQVIKGWDEGVLGMQLGEVARLRCTPDYAYGAGGFPAWGIQPNSVLVFEIEVLSAQ